MKKIPLKLEEHLASASKLDHYKDGSSDSSVPTLPQIFDDSVERAMYDEIFGSILHSGNNRGSFSKPTIPKASHISQGHHSTADGNKTDFTTALLTRLKAVEADAADYKKKLAQQISLNERMHGEVNGLKEDVLRLSRESSAQSLIKDLKSERDQSARLQLKICEMEKFLADYGLVWVGSGRQSGHDDCEEEENEEDEDEDNAGSNAGQQHQVSFAAFSARVEELNAALHAEGTQVVTTGHNKRTARLAHATDRLDSIRIGFYKNGLMVQRGPFRSCDSPSYASFLRDIMDGYFPSEFRGPHPDGVFLDLADRSGQVYTPGCPDDVSARMDKDQLLRRLPKTVIRKGQVIDLRTDLEERLSGGDKPEAPFTTATTTDTRSNINTNTNKGKFILLSTPASAMVNGITNSSTNNGTSSSTSSSSANNGTSGSSSSTNNGASGISSSTTKGTSGSSTNNAASSNIVTIQIKWLDRSTFLAKMFESDSVQDLKKEVLKNLAALNIQSSASSLSSVSEFEFRVAQPSPRALLDHLTLKEEGLVPNGTVHAKMIP